MHIADALISPAVGGTFWAISGGMLVRASRRLRKKADHSLAPLMAVLGAFIFSAQMLNFTIPFTGCGGHIGGGLILAALLGSDAALIVITSILTVQALFFADGGLMALGCNIFNMGVIPCYIAYPLVYRPIAGADEQRQTAAAVTACAAALTLGALAVTAETVLSGISDLPFPTFASLMIPIHLMIGIIEGIISAAVIRSVRCSAPELKRPVATEPLSLRTVLTGLLVAATVTATGLAAFASTKPDGLEWATAKTTAENRQGPPGTAPDTLLNRLQKKTAFMPDYSFSGHAGSKGGNSSYTGGAGLIGAAITVTLIGIFSAFSRYPGRSD